MNILLCITSLLSSSRTIKPKFIIIILLLLDRCMFLWRLDTSDLSEAPKIFAEEGDGEKVENRENWTVIKQFRFGLICGDNKDIVTELNLSQSSVD